MTLQKKWDEIKGLIEERIEAFIKSLGTLPTIIYEVTPVGELIEKPVLGYEYYNTDQRLYYTGKKPTREDVRRIESVFYNLVKDEKYVRFKYDQWNSYNMEQIKMYNLFLEKEPAEAKAKEIASRIALENRLLAGGDYDRCQRCRKVVPKAQIVTSTIIGRSRNSFGKAIITQTPMRFCSGECAGCEQMSREG